MTDIKTIEGTFIGGKGNYCIVVGRWNSFVVEHLLEGAVDTLRRHGVSDKQITIVRAPGAFEIPLVCKKVAAKELRELNIERADFHGDWNYVIRPRKQKQR